MKQLDIKAVQHRLLNIATVVDELCAKHDIPLYMIAGTMLGAVRHKGFIPWDDDMDFAVPYRYYYELIDVLNKELSADYRCITYKESKTYTVPWIKVEDARTVVFDKDLDLKEDELPGLTIDIFPIVNCERGECDLIIEKIQNKVRRLSRVLSLSHIHNQWMLFLKRPIRLLLSQIANRIISGIFKNMDAIPPGEFYIIPVDPNYHNRYFPKQWFTPLKRFTFENISFYGVSDYDNYLKELYHDYWELPPEEKRRIHCNSVYVKP